MPFDVVHLETWTLALTTKPTMTLRELVEMLPTVTLAAVKYRV